MKSLTEIATHLQMTTKGVKWRLNKFKIVPTNMNNELFITDQQFKTIDYQNTNIKELVYVTETYYIYQSKMNL